MAVVRRPATALELAAAALVVLALAVVLAIAVEVAIDASEASAGGGLPAAAGRLRIVWVRAPAPGSDLRCYVARAPTASVRGLWLCG